MLIHQLHLILSGRKNQTQCKRKRKTADTTYAGRAAVGW
ncbi:hypothetical protein EC80586_4053 [Escherichia coli 8.0586]|nr:hypothetical protein EC80586_4053 [Escherichia coli 8.0586]